MLVGCLLDLTVVHSTVTPTAEALRLLGAVVLK
jgi:hypothetical protein